MSGAILQACLLLSALVVEGQEPTPPAEAVPQAEAPADLKPEHASVRIKRRNLFDPSRGTSRLAGGAAPAADLPVLVGTLVMPKRRSALLKLANREEAISLLEGAEAEGIRLKRVQANRVQVLRLVDGSEHWLELDPKNAPENSPGEDLTGLFKPRNPVKPSSPQPPAGGSKP